MFYDNYTDEEIIKAAEHTINNLIRSLAKRLKKANKETEQFKKQISNLIKTLLGLDSSRVKL